MAIIIRTSNPQTLLQNLNVAISEERIRTWLVDVDGDYSATPDKWKYKAWFRPVIKSDESLLVFGIVKSMEYTLTCEIYGVYHGRFIATLLSHFDEIISHIEITPNLDHRYDIF